MNRIFQCSVCKEWHNDWDSYRYSGRVYCTDDLPTDGWELVLNGTDPTRRPL